MSLNDSKIRNLKPVSRPVKHTDSHGLYLLVSPGGSRIWYLKYRFNGKESRVSLGAYPAVSLAQAREQRDGIRKLLAQNINPSCKHTCFSSTHFLRVPVFQPSAGIPPASGYSGIHGDARCCIHSASVP